MKHLKSILVIISFLLVLPSALFAKYVAVLETMADPAAKDLVSLSDRTYLTNVLREEAVKVLPAEQNFTIMTRENINAMLPPGKSIEDCEGSCLAETGKNIAADYVAQARVGTFSGSLTLSVEIYETAGNKLVASFNGDGGTLKDLLNIIRKESPAFFKKVKVGATGFDGVGGIGAVQDAGSFSFKGSQKFIVEIETTPAGALPTVDGKGFQKCTNTPCTVQIEAGEHRFVASMDRYVDAEQVVAISANNQKVVLNLTPNFGSLDLQPKLLDNVGSISDLQMTVDGQAVNYGIVELNPGLHAVSVKHPCYDPAEFKVSIEKSKTETFDAVLKRGVGGLVLGAELKGEAQAVPVTIDGKDVGSTPFEGEVPMCAEILVGYPGHQEKVAVDLKWHEVVNATHNIGASLNESDLVKLRAENAYNELDGKDGKTIPANVDSDKGGIHWVPVAISGAVLVAGSVLAVVGNAKAKAASEEKIKSEKDYKKYRDDAKNGQTLRTVGVATAIVGAVGLGVSFAF